MKGIMYIAQYFETVNRSKCGRGRTWIDNDPHFWTSPPTWGICRPDWRSKADKGDYVFFVLGARARHPQMILGYLRIAKFLTHEQAFRCRTLRSKRMGNKNPNGNIIVDKSGGYNRFDGGRHKATFARIKDRYAVGAPQGSRLLTSREIRHLAPRFVPTLQKILGRDGARPIELISKHGRELSEARTHSLLRFLNR